jgi:hypothetical protein
VPWLGRGRLAHMRTGRPRSLQVWVCCTMYRFPSPPTPLPRRHTRTQTIFHRILMRYPLIPPSPFSLRGRRGGRYRFRVLMLSEAPLSLRERGLG